MNPEIQGQIDHFNDVISRGGPAHAYAKLADVYRKAGRTKDAAQTARTGLVKHPDSLVIQESLGLCLLDLGEAEPAVRALAPVVEKLPENATAAVALAIALARINRAPDSIKVLKRRLEKDPFDKKASALLAQLEAGKSIEPPRPAESTAPAPSARPAPVEPKAPEAKAEPAPAPSALKPAAPLPREEAFPLLMPTGIDQTDVEYQIKPAGALFDNATFRETDALLDMKSIFDERPRQPEPKPSEEKAASAAASESPVKTVEAPKTQPEPVAVKAEEKKVEPAVPPAPPKTEAPEAAPASVKKETPAAAPSPKAQEVSTEEASAAETAEPPLGFWRRLWRKLTGRGIIDAAAEGTNDKEKDQPPARPMKSDKKSPK